jgi:hypothetical protein
VRRIVDSALFCQHGSNTNAYSYSDTDTNAVSATTFAATNAESDAIVQQCGGGDAGECQLQ